MASGVEQREASRGAPAITVACSSAPMSAASTGLPTARLSSTQSKTSSTVDQFEASGHAIEICELLLLASLARCRASE